MPKPGQKAALDDWLENELASGDVWVSTYRSETALAARQARITILTMAWIEGIVAARPISPSLDAMRGWLAALEQGLAREDRSVIFGVLRDAVPDFGGEAA